MGPTLPVPPIRGGAVERIWYALCQEFARHGHQVTMISRRFPGLPDIEIEPDGLRHVRVTSRLRTGRLGSRLTDLAYGWRARRALETADVTVTNSPVMPLIAPRSRSGRLYASIARWPKSYLRLYRRVDRIHAVSAAVGREIGLRFPFLGSRVVVIPNALSHRFAAAALSSEAKNGFDVLYVGRIAREKGLDLLIEGFLSSGIAASDWTLSIMGPVDEAEGGDGGSLMADLARKAGDHPAIRFEPPLFDENALIERMRRAAIFVYPSVAERGESFGLAPLEAMACGCAVIVSGLECFREFVRPGVNAEVFDHRDRPVAALSRLLASLVADPMRRERLSIEGRATAADYAPAIIAERFIAEFGTAA